MSKLIGKLKKTLLGRVTCVTLGNRRGGILLEYVVLAVLLVTAVVVAVIYFGRTLQSGMAATTSAVAGKPKDAQTEVTDVMRERAADTKNKGLDHAKVIAVSPED